MFAAQQRLNSLPANRTAPGLPQASQVIDLHDFPGMARSLLWLLRSPLDGNLHAAFIASGIADPGSDP